MVDNKETIKLLKAAIHLNLYTVFKLNICDNISLTLLRNSVSVPGRLKHHPEMTSH